MSSTHDKKTIIYKKIQDVELKANVYFPKGINNHKTILWLHPGAMMMCDREVIIAEQVQFYNALGYTVFSIDYRLGPETKLAEIVSDVVAAYNWLRENGPKQWQLNPEAITLVGHSAGGYLALLLGAILNEKPASIISFYGYGDLAWFCGVDPYYLEQPLVNEEQAKKGIKNHIVTGTQFTGFSDPRWLLYLYYRQQGIWLQEVAGTADLEALQVYCPINNIQKDYPPTLLIHGDQDTDVPVEQSIQMTEALTEHGVANELVKLKGIGHMFDRHPDGMSEPTVKAVFHKVSQFLN